MPPTVLSATGGSGTFHPVASLPVVEFNTILQEGQGRAFKGRRRR